MQDKLYDRDFNLWVEEMAIALRNRDIKAMDWIDALAANASRLAGDSCLFQIGFA